MKIAENIFFNFLGMYFPYIGIFSEMELKTLIVNHNSNAKINGTNID